MSEQTSNRGIGQRKIGVVVSKPGIKTVKIQVERLMEHKVYRRYIRRSKNFLAHDEHDVCALGDKVEIVESRPISATKRWRVRRVIARSEMAAAAAAAAAPSGDQE